MELMLRKDRKKSFYMKVRLVQKILKPQEEGTLRVSWKVRAHYPTAPASDQECGIFSTVVSNAQPAIGRSAIA